MNDTPDKPRETPGIQVGEFTLFQSGDSEFIGIFRKNSEGGFEGGFEGGLFQTKEFEAYVAAFFGLNLR